MLRLRQIQLKEIFETDANIALVLELVTGGELFDRWAPAGSGTAPLPAASLTLRFVSRIVERGYYSERDAAHVIKQILEAVAVISVRRWLWCWLVGLGAGGGVGSKKSDQRSQMKGAGSKKSDERSQIKGGRWKGPDQRSQMKGAR